VRAKLRFRPTKQSFHSRDRKSIRPDLADFAALRKCLVVEAVRLLEQFHRLGHLGVRVFAKARGVPLGMSSIQPKCPDSGAPDRWVADDFLLRQEPDEEEDEEEDEGDRKNEDDDDDTTDDGYSE
jgi:hypothetical protein